MEKTALTHIAITNNVIPANGGNERATQLIQLSPCNDTAVDRAGRGRYPTTETTSRKKYSRRI